ncbi:4'-phosphopantetheinyl transferase EntD [Actinoplanes lutulentus]|uniref:4'-phosphopantetheinyl transferase EntD n=1 Tax=Actinoplanes lutulentus TaxID=1287878 RepID=A0A327ZCS3_9ACTN|nr:4'-phosphopantetheinyl transferase superfamily protein [Actinoplanes lutulentus]MBB2942540.1 4'-phosphopantetheinyl transferase EntD [Actinoplanes lutulentus]RAK38121.1 4'-phosphopantetheinyl transferase EntD [Actinoplanes lutulentus]
MLELLLPSSVRTAEAFTDDPSEPCFPGEEDLIATAVPGRRREFLTARRCAREALALLGQAPVAIRPGPRREPLWPDGVTGSITHCAGYRAAAVAVTADVRGLGIDAEPHAPLPPRVLPAVTTAQDQEHLAVLAKSEPSVHWDRLLFSAKESVYKAWYPVARTWLGFTDAHLIIDPGGLFRAEILIDGPFEKITGRWVIEHGLVVTAVTVDH